MDERRVVSVLCWLLLVQFCFCCDFKTFFNSQVVISRLPDNSDYEVVTIDGCVDGSDKYHDITYFRANASAQVEVLRQGAIVDLPKLITIFFKFNKLKQIKKGAMKNLNSLENLIITNNSITKIDSDVFFELPVKRIILADNKIEAIELRAFSTLPNLEELYLTNNNLKYFYRQWFHKTKNLKVLVMSNNQIFTLPSRSFANTPRVELLGLNKNFIENIHPTAFSGLENLKELDLSKNRIKILPPNLFKSLQSCEYLYLNGNNLTFLYDEILSDLLYLTALTVHSNPLQCTCMKQIEKWAVENSIELNTFHTKCIIATNPVCINYPPAKDKCMQDLYEDFITNFYKNFLHPPRDCEDDPFEL